MHCGTRHLYCTRPGLSDLWNSDGDATLQRSTAYTEIKVPSALRIQNCQRLCLLCLKQVRIQLCMFHLLPGMLAFRFLPFLFIHLHLLLLPILFHHKVTYIVIVNQTVTCDLYIYIFFFLSPDITINIMIGCRYEIPSCFLVSAFLWPFSALWL